MKRKKAWVWWHDEKKRACYGDKHCTTAGSHLMDTVVILMFLGS